MFFSYQFTFHPSIILQLSVPASCEVLDQQLRNNYFKAHIGSGRVDTLRGKVPASTGSFYYATGRLTGTAMLTGKNEPILGIYDGDGIFSRFNLAQMGAILELTPMPGLYFGAAFAPNTGTGLSAKDVYQGLHAAAGYEIKDIGLIRIGYIGGSTNPTNKASANAGANWDFSWDKRIEAAFNLKAIPKFNIDFGLKYSLEEHPGTLSQRDFYSKILSTLPLLCRQNPLTIL